MAKFHYIPSHPICFLFHTLIPFNSIHFHSSIIYSFHYIPYMTMNVWVPLSYSGRAAARYTATQPFNDSLLPHHSLNFTQHVILDAVNTAKQKTLRRRNKKGLQTVATNGDNMYYTRILWSPFKLIYEERKTLSVMTISSNQIKVSTLQV